MSVMPRDKVGQIEFATSHVEKWLEHAIAIGSSPERIEELAAKIAEARAAFNEQKQAQLKARAATMKFHLAVDAMSAITQEVITTARTKAIASGDNEIFVLASIPTPKNPSPIRELDKPHRFSAKLGALGTIILQWKCTQPRGATGVIYQVSRQLGSTGEMLPIGVTGKKKFLDATIPQGTSIVTYNVRAVRSTGTSEWASYDVKFGANFGKQFLSIVTRSSPNLAA